MTRKIVSHGKALGQRINARLAINVELPEWLLRILEYRVAKANENATSEDDEIDLNDVIEWCLVAPITIGEVPLFEERLPGTAAALSSWLNTAVYEPHI